MNNDKKLWFAVDIETDAIATEAIEFALNELGALGTEIDSFLSRRTNRCGCRDTLKSCRRTRTSTRPFGRHYGSITTFPSESRVSQRVRSNRRTGWPNGKSIWHPTVIGDFIIAPPWETVDDESKMVIRIEPNMAFGTGTHETTQLCVSAIGEELAPGESFLDVGTGTGILAIAAAKLGKRHIVACDVDEDSVKIAIENGEMNGTGDIEFFLGEIGDGTDMFDFVCANLTIDVILPMIDLLLAKTKRVLLLSGILGTQTDMITEALETRAVERYWINSAGEWISVTVKRN